MMPTPLVGDATAHYHGLLAGSFDPAGWWPAHRAEVERNWHTEAKTEAYVLRPLFIDEATYASTQARAGMIGRGLALAADALAASEPLRRALRVPAYMDPLLEFDRANGKPPVLGRIDGHMAPDGRLTVIEFNSEPQSAPYQYELERSFDRLPVKAEFEKRFHVRTVDTYARMLEALRERGKSGRLPTIAILDKALWASHRKAGIYKPVLYASARGCPVMFVDPEELDYRAGRLTANGIAVDMVAFPSWDLMINARKRLVKVLKAVTDGNVEVYAGLSRGLLASYKTVFELLSSTAHHALFPAEIVAALAAHVPWTRVLYGRRTDNTGVDVDRIPFGAANRRTLVIKPAGGGGGGNIFVGKDLTDEAWAAAIQKGCAQNWIVQAYAPPHRESFPVGLVDGSVGYHDLNCEYTPYLWNGYAADGVLCRVVAGSVISDLGDRPIGISNGIETPTWIIDRK